MARMKCGKLVLCAVAARPAGTAWARRACKRPTSQRGPRLRAFAHPTPPLDHPITYRRMVGRTRAQPSPGGADRRGHESRQRFPLLGREAQAELAAPPQHVILGLRPFPLHQITHLDRREIGAQPRAELLPESRRTEHALDPRSIGAHETPDLLLVEKWPRSV